MPLCVRNQQNAYFFLGARVAFFAAENCITESIIHAGTICLHYPHSLLGDPQKAQQQNGRQDTWNLQRASEGPTSVDTGGTPIPGDGDHARKEETTFKQSPAWRIAEERAKALE